MEKRQYYEALKTLEQLEHTMLPQISGSVSHFVCLLSVCLCDCPCVCLSVCLLVCLSATLSVCLSERLLVLPLYNGIVRVL